VLPRLLRVGQENILQPYLERVGVRSMGILSVVIALGTTACAVPFADTDFAPYRGDGAATLEGQAYLDVGTNDPHVLMSSRVRYDDEVSGLAGFSH
jgi:hypothetical protein